MITIPLNHFEQKSVVFKVRVFSPGTYRVILKYRFHAIEMQK